MRAALVLLSVFGPLAVLASNPERGLEGDIQDSPVAPTPDPFGEGTALYKQWPQLGSVPPNRTEGSVRREKHQANNALQARQTEACLDPGFILVCPITDPFPCCDPSFPICCHSSTCCPTGTFCGGTKTCCQQGSVGCDEGCCPKGTSCCGTACCTAGFACVRPGECQSTNTVTSTRSTTSKLAPSISTTVGSGTLIPTEASDANTSNNNAAVIGGAVGGTIGGLVLIGGCVAAWYFHTRRAAAEAAEAAKAAKAGATGYAGGAGNPGTLGNAYAPGAAHPQSYGWATGASGSPSVGQPLMTSTSMPFTPGVAANAGFAAQQMYGAPGPPYMQPLTPTNGIDYSQPPVGQYPQGAYGAAAPPASSASGPSYSDGSPAPNTAGGSAYGGVAAGPMQPGQVAYGGIDPSTAYAQSHPSPPPQVQTWVERSGGQ